MSKQLILVDGSSYLHRAFHALPSLTNSKGQATGAIYGVINMLQKLLKEHAQDNIAVVFDAKGKNFRHEMYPEYKANRGAMDDELVSQIAPLHETIDALGLPIIAIAGVEADDVIATLARQAKEKDIDVLVITGDKDLAQIVDDKVTLLDTMKDRKMDRAGVQKKFGANPEQIIDYLALIGDSSDNVPGIPGVGPKTAVKWLSNFGCLDAIVEHAHEIKGKVGEKFRANLNLLDLAKKLVTVKDDVDVKTDLSNLKLKPQNRDKLIQLFSELEFASLLKSLLAGNDIKTFASSEQNSVNRNYHTVLDSNDFDKLLQQIQTCNQLCFDTETNSLDSLQADLVGISLAIKANEAFYIPLAHNYPDVPKQIPRDEVLAKLRPIFTNSKMQKIGQNIKYDLNVLSTYGIKVNNVAFDTMLEAYILNSAGRHDMDTLALKYLGEKTTSFEEIAGKGSKQVTFDKVALNIASDYSCEDADVTLRLHNELLPKLENDSPLLKVFTEIEMPLVTVLADMEQNGVAIDTNLLDQQSQELGARITELEQLAYKDAGQEFNLSSPKQLREILFDKLQLPVLSKTATGEASTAEQVLHDLAALNFALPTIIIEHRTLSKLKSTYTDALPNKINPRTGRIHTSYNQAITSTGRLSSTDPNLQNIPIRTEEGRRVRQAFIGENGNKIVAADYSQIELRIMAHLSGDPGLCQAFKNGLDVHAATAAEVFGVPLEEVGKEQRRRAKAINFGLIYGMSSFGLGRQLGIERKEADHYIETYFARYPLVKKYMDTARSIAGEQGYVETIFGRRLYVPDINATNYLRRSAAERAAINAPMQGSAADIIKLAMIKVNQFIQNSDLDIKMLMQVHDELVFEVAQKDVANAQEKIKTIMENSVQLTVPLIVDVGIGNNWDEAH